MTLVAGLLVSDDDVDVDMSTTTTTATAKFTKEFQNLRTLRCFIFHCNETCELLVFFFFFFFPTNTNFPVAL